MGEEDVFRTKLESIEEKLDETKEVLRRNNESNSSAHKEIYRCVAESERKIACIEYVDRAICFVGGVGATLLIQRIFA